MSDSRPKPLPPDRLHTPVDPGLFKFETTSELANGPETIGQTRATEAIRFGIGIDHRGYNLYLLGPEGAGRHTLIRSYLDARAPGEPRPDDWCYVQNFDHPYQPRALRLPPGRARALDADMKRLVEELTTVLPAAFTTEEYQSRRKAIEEELRGRHSEAMDALREKAQAQSVAFIQTPNGFGFAPLRDGEVISPDEFMRLPIEEQKQIEAEIVALQEDLQHIMRQIPAWQRDTQAKIKQLDEEVAEFAVSSLFDELARSYEGLDQVLAHIAAIRRDVIQNFRAFIEEDDGQARQMLGAALGIASSPPGSRASRYAVNVMVDNTDTNGAPVINADQPRYQNLVGRIEHLAQMGALVTDFTLIKPGALHLANGGYLIVEVRKLLTEPFAWDGLKRCLRNGTITIESLGQVYSMVSTVSLEPEPIPLDVKVILVGDRELYYLLAQFDPEFGELFKVAADFEDEVDRTPENYQAFARVVAALARQEELRPLDRAAVARVAEHGSRLVGDAERLTTHIRDIGDLLREANYWAGEGERDIVTAEDVQRAIDQQRYRAGRVRERIQESILRELVLIDTSGEVVGQVNGLSVILLGSESFGRPSRITARVRMGKGEVIDIERQVDMGGPIHSKGVLILSAFLGARYAADRPLSLSATLVFEQSYGLVEGDSASSAELYALLSALSGVPIRQSLAVTGSVNQNGQIQVIGGVNEKIEGFFDLCQARGLTGEQGVLIPAGNVQHLMLRQDVVDAVVAGKFAIYSVTTVDEGITLLTGIDAGEADINGEYPPESINGRVIAKLAAFAEKQREFAAQREPAAKAVASDGDGSTTPGA